MKLTRKAAVAELSRRLTTVEPKEPTDPKDINRDVLSFRQVKPNKWRMAFAWGNYNITLRKNKTMVFKEHWM